MYSICSHGPTPSLITHLEPLFEAYRVTAYLSGHDHCQVVVEKSPDLPLYTLTGNGMYCCYADEKASDMASKYPDASVLFSRHMGNSGFQLSGFASFQLNDDHAYIRMHDDQGNDIFSATRPSRNI